MGSGGHGGGVEEDGVMARGVVERVIAAMQLMRGSR